MLLLPYGCFKKSPQARLALRALKHLFIIFFHAAGRVPGRISKKYNMQNLLQITQEIRCGISLFHREKSTLILLAHLGKCFMCIKLYLNSQNCTKTSFSDASESCNWGPTCCAYSKRAIRNGAGGSRPGNTADLSVSRASMKRPHSIILPMLQKSASLSCGDKRTIVKWGRFVETEDNAALIEMDGQERGKRAEW